MTRDTRPPRITPQQLHAAHRWIPLDEVALLPGNPNQGDTESLNASLDEFGWVDGIVIHQGTVIAGNHRVKKARDDGETGLPGYDLSDLDLDDARRMAIALAHNHTTRAGTNDPALLADALAAIGTADPALAVVAGVNSIDPATSELLDVETYQRRPPTPAHDPDTDDLTPPTKAVTKHGDLWEIGPHRILCGDCSNPDDVARLLDGATIDLGFTSPPYADRRVYDETTTFRPIPPDDYVEWFAPIAANVAANLSDDGSWFVNIKPSADDLDNDTYVMDLVLAHAREWGWHWVTEFCWERNGVPKRVSMRFKNQFEPVYQFARGRFKIRPDNVRHRSDNVPIPFGPGAGETNWAKAQGGNGAMFGAAKKRKNGTSGNLPDNQGVSYQPGEFVAPGLAYPGNRLDPMDPDDAPVMLPEGLPEWFVEAFSEFIAPAVSLPGNRLPTFAGTHEATGHAAAYPVGLPAWFAKAYTDPGDTVFDPFLGSGSTVLAAHQTDRIGYGLELSPAYVDIAVARIQRVTGLKPKRNGRTRNMAK